MLKERQVHINALKMRILNALKNNKAFLRWIVFSVVITMEVVIVLCNVVPKYEFHAVTEKGFSGSEHVRYYKFNNSDGSIKRWDDSSARWLDEKNRH